MDGRDILPKIQDDFAGIADVEGGEPSASYHKLPCQQEQDDEQYPDGQIQKLLLSWSRPSKGEDRLMCRKSVHMQRLVVNGGENRLRHSSDRDRAVAARLGLPG